MFFFRSGIEVTIVFLSFKQGTGLQGQAIFRNKLSFRPHSTESFTHQKMTRQMADRTNRGQGIKVISQVT